MFLLKPEVSRSCSARPAHENEKKRLKPSIMLLRLGEEGRSTMVR